MNMNMTRGNRWRKKRMPPPPRNTSTILLGSLDGIHVVPQAGHEVPDLDLAVKVVLLYALGADAEVVREVQLLLDGAEPVREVRCEVQRVW